MQRMIVVLLSVVVQLCLGSRRRRNRHIYVYNGESSDTWSSLSFHSYSSDDGYSSLQTDSTSGIEYYSETGSRSDTEDSESSESYIESVMTTLERSLQQQSSNQRKRKNSRRAKEVQMFRDYVNKHLQHTDRKSQRGTSRRMTKRDSSHHREPTQCMNRRESRAAPTKHMLRTSYHATDRTGSSSTSEIASDQSYTIEFSSEHHRRFRRHISRSNRLRQQMSPAVLQQQQTTML